jgi:hypothetical protein
LRSSEALRLAKAAKNASTASAQAGWEKKEATRRAAVEKQRAAVLAVMHSD